MGNKKRYLKYLLHIAVLAGLIWATVKYVNGQGVVEALQKFNYGYLPFLLILSLVYFLLKGWRFAILTAPFVDNLPALVVYKIYAAGQAAAMLPGGIAARVGFLKQVDIPVSQSSVPVALHSGWDQAIFLLGALIAAFWVPQARIPVLIALGVLTVIAILLFFDQTRKWFERQGERVAGHFGYKEQWERFLEAVPRIFTRRIVLTSFVLTIAALAVYSIILYLTLQGFDLSVSIPVLLLSVILPTMLGRLVPVPGGFGVTEASMVGFLTGIGQLNIGTTVAAVAIFRVATIVFPAVLGALVYFLWWRGEDEERQSSEEESKKQPATKRTRTADAS